MTPSDNWDHPSYIDVVADYEGSYAFPFKGPQTPALCVDPERPGKCRRTYNDFCHQPCSVCGLTLPSVRAPGRVMVAHHRDPRTKSGVRCLSSRRRSGDCFHQGPCATLGLHDLRHTHATILLRRGVHPKIVQERLGHATIAVTLDTYSHVLPDMQQAAVSALDAVFGA